MWLAWQEMNVIYYLSWCDLLLGRMWASPTLWSCWTKCLSVFCLFVHTLCPNHSQSAWNWKTKVPASDKHYWLANSSSSGDLSLFLDVFVFSCQTSKCRLLASHIIVNPRVTKVHATLQAHVRTYAYSYTICSYARLLSKLTPSYYYY